MPLSKLVFKPGINREGTNYSNEGGWHDGDKIRFRYGYPEKIGGWEKVNPTAYAGTPRFVHDFVTLSSQSLLFIGTEKKAYLEESGSLYDITPYRRTVALPYEITGVEAGFSVGSVTVSIGGPLPSVAEVKGVAGTGVAGILEAVVTEQNATFGEGATGFVGVVTVVAEPVDTIVAYGARSVTIGELANPMVGSVGSVTITAIRN